MHEDSRIFIAGHRGLVGSAIHRRCQTLGFRNLLTATRQELDLREQAPVRQFFESNKPDYVFLAAAHVGGIQANMRSPADFIWNNVMIVGNVLEAAFRSGVRKLLFLGSSCIYPRAASQPMREEYVLTGPLEPTNEPYAMAKLAGLKMCQAFREQYAFDAIVALPTNIYGPGDNFDLATSHVVPALMRKIDAARESGAEAVTVWGSGNPRRELLFVDDVADACVFLMERYSDPRPINVGCGEDLSIKDLAATIAQVVGFEGRFEFDHKYPDGMPRKRLDVARLSSLGWNANTSLHAGLTATWKWYRRRVLTSNCSSSQAVA